MKYELTYFRDGHSVEETEEFRFPAFSDLGYSLDEIIEWGWAHGEPLSIRSLQTGATVWSNARYGDLS